MNKPSMLLRNLHAKMTSVKNSSNLAENQDEFP